VGSYLLNTEYEVVLPGGHRPSPEGVTDWLERRMRGEALNVRRIGETMLEFRSRFGLLRNRYLRPSLTFLARGEVEVRDGASGPIIAVRANPHMWDGLIPIIAMSFAFGWTTATGLLRWIGALCGIVLGGILLFLNWSALRMFLQSTSANLRIWQTGRSYLPLSDDGAA